MNKIICDICGTTYPETADCCPICGSSREFSSENPDYTPSRMPEYIPENRKKGGLFSATLKKAQQEFYDFEEPDSDIPMDILPEVYFSSDSEADPQYTDQRPRMNLFAVVLLTILITVLVLVGGFLFFRYYLPNQFPDEHVAQTEEEETEPVQTETEETTEPTVPCQSLVLTTGVPDITRIGQYWLLHVIVMPENTTDQLVYTSSDESIVTVTAEGRLCAVGEGQTTVVISCGDKEILCPITVRIPVETEPEASEATQDEAPEGQALSEEETQPEETGSQTETVTEETEPSSEATQAPANSGEIVLKLKQSDITFKKKGVTFQLEMDCDLDPKDVTWLTMDPDVAICHDGLITVLGNGTTKIVAQYGNQEVYCIVRCNFS